MSTTLSTLVHSLFPSKRRTQNRSPHLEAGRFGELVAARFLRGIGYSILGRNVRLGRDEIDLIAYDPEDRVIVFAEVKSRSHWHEDYTPDLNADAIKRSRLLRSARTWVAEHGYDGGYRIDLVCVAGGQVVQHVRELTDE
jgi:putative endonuclease